MESVEKLGRWWLPETGGVRKTGTLRFSRESGVTLHLVGALAMGDGAAELATTPFIQGQTVDGEEVTLVDCHETSRRGGHTENGLEPEEQGWRAQFGLIGAHFESSQDLIFDEVDVRLSSLDQWTDLGPLIQWQGFEEGEVRPSFPAEVRAYRFARPLPIDLASVPGLAQVGVVHGSTSQENTGYIEERIFPAFFARPEVPIPIADALDAIVQPLRYFLCLASDVPIDVLHVSLLSPHWVNTYGSGTTIRPPIQLLYTVGSLKGSDPPTPFQMVFSLGKNIELVRAALDRWFALFVELRECLDLLFDVLLSSGVTTLETRFLVAMQAAEVYHRLRLSAAVPVPEHAERLSRIYDRVPAEDLTWLKERLRYSHEPSLRQRLDDLVNYVGPAYSNHPWSRKKFTRLAADTRNYVTHWDRRSKSRAAHLEELYWLTEAVIMLMKAVLLKELGFPDDLAASSLAKTPHGQAVMIKAIPAADPE